jgi:hypothetical protein
MHEDSFTAISIQLCLGIFQLYSNFPDVIAHFSIIIFTDTIELPLFLPIMLIFSGNTVTYVCSFRRV